MAPQTVALQTVPTNPHKTVVEGQSSRAGPWTIRVEPLERTILEGVDDPRVPLDVAVIPLFSDERPVTGVAAFFDWRSSGTLSALLRSGWWAGEVGESLLVPARSTLPVDRIVLFGLGPSDGFDQVRAEAAAASMVAVAQGLSPRGVLLAMPGMGQERVIVEALFAAALAALSASAAASDTAAATAVADPGVAQPETHAEPEQGEPASAEAVEVDSDGGPTPPGDAEPEPAAEPTPQAQTDPPTAPDTAGCAWWAVADPRHVARLRRVLEGPPRAAGES